MLNKLIETAKLLTTKFLKVISKAILLCIYKCIDWIKPSSLKGNTEMSAFAYPKDFPLAEAKGVIDIVRSGDLLGKKEALAHDAWVVQGYAQSMLIGDPLPLAYQAEDLKNSNIEPLAVLEKVVSDVEGGTLSAQIAIPWASIIRYVMEILLSLLEE